MAKKPKAPPPPDEASVAEAEKAVRRKEYEARMAASGNMDDATYSKVAWGLGLFLASRVKDRLARAWDASVCSLTLSRAGMTLLEVQALGKALAWNDALTYLDLGWNGFGVAEVACVAAGLKDNRTLTALRLWNNPGIGDEGAAHLSGLLKLNSTLSALELSVTGLTEAGAGYLNSALQRNTSLTALYLNRNELGDGGWARLCAEKEGSMISLRTLGLGSTGGGDEGAAAVAALIARSFTLFSLDLSGNRISYVGLDPLGDSLAINKSVEVLDCGSNGFGAAGAIVLSSYIPGFRRLRELSFSDNRIGDAGLRALVPALCVCKPLVSLDLSSNYLSAASGKVREGHEGVTVCVCV